MSIFRKTLSCAVLAALGTCALAGCGRQDTSNEATTSASPEAPAAITETISESTASSEQTSSSEASGHSPLKPNQQFPRRPLSMTPPPSDSTALSMWRTGS